MIRPLGLLSLSGCLLGPWPYIEDPPLMEIIFNPASPSTNDVIEASYLIHDPRLRVEVGEPSWERDGLLVDDADGWTIPATQTTDGETWEIFVLASGIERGPRLVSGRVVIGAASSSEPDLNSHETDTSGHSSATTTEPEPPLDLPAFNHPRLGDFIEIPPGTFSMGCTDGMVIGSGSDDCHTDERPVTEVTLTRPYFMMKTEVLRRHWGEIFDEDPSTPSGCGLNCPVQGLNWFEAIAFANEVSDRDGFTQCYTLSGCDETVIGVDFSCDAVEINSPTGSLYDCEGYRLPTEAEWEYAARAGTDHTYAGSDDINDVAWWFNDGGAPMAPCQKLENRFGLCDMTGNAAEWVWDRHGAYPGSPRTDPTGHPSGLNYVVRGGSHRALEWTSRVSSRIRRLPYGRGSNESGLRLVRTAPAE